MKPLKALLFAVLLAAPAGHALAQSAPTPDEEKAFFAISDENRAAKNDLPTQIYKGILAHPRDDRKICDLSKTFTAIEWMTADHEQAYLAALIAKGRKVDRMIGVFLGEASLADSLAIHESEYCATVEAQTTKADDTQETVIYIRTLLERQAAAKKAFDAATAAHDKLGRLRAIQSQAAFLDEIVAQIEIVRDYGEKVSAEGKAQIAHLPQYKADLASVTALNQAEVKVYTDTGHV